MQPVVSQVMQKRCKNRAAFILLFVMERVFLNGFSDPKMLELEDVFQPFYTTICDFYLLLL